MNLIIFRPFQNLKSINSFKSFCNFGFQNKKPFQKDMSISQTPAQVEQEMARHAFLKTTKTYFPFWKNYVGSDFSIAHWRYVGIKSMHFIEPKKPIKTVLFSSPQIQTFMRYHKHLHTNLARMFPWNTTDVEGA